ncbi:hypothetical protein AB0J01_41330 [Streptomyces sp. NPDC050204]|uniref:hypothetical protein n=1 Tax=Streptomyces sp. NPDC050204 TaxID=3155514 RepID=UPI003424A300
MARNIGMTPEAEVWRAVITKTFPDGTTETVYAGPYGAAAQARGRVTFWRNYLAKYGKGAKADGHVERARPVWERAEDTVPRRKAPAAGAEDREPEGSTAVQLVRDAVEQRRVTHGRHVADLLDEHGHGDDAARVSAEVRAQHGHLSARQALALLEQGSGDQ